MSNMYSIGQMNQLGDALEKAGFSVADLTKLQQFTKLTEIRELLNGRAKLILPKQFINCDAEPFIPPGWQIKKHIKMGYWRLEIDKIFLLNLQEKIGKHIIGEDLEKKLCEYPIFNANVLDYLLKQPHLIPDYWKSLFIFFWGTIYSSTGDDSIVRCLRWNNVKQNWEWFWAKLNYRFSASCPVAILKDS